MDQNGLDPLNPTRIQPVHFEPEPGRVQSNWAKSGSIQLAEPTHWVNSVWVNWLSQPSLASRLINRVKTESSQSTVQHSKLQETVSDPFEVWFEFRVKYWIHSWVSKILGEFLSIQTVDSISIGSYLVPVLFQLQTSSIVRAYFRPDLRCSRGSHLPDPIAIVQDFRGWFSSPISISLRRFLEKFYVWAWTTYPPGDILSWADLLIA